MVQSGSLPYVLLLAAVTIGVSVLLWTTIDYAVGELFATAAWGEGSEHADRGHAHLEDLWGWTLALVITSVSLSVIVASRRGA